MGTAEISAFIIDDDSEAIFLLEMYLRQFPDITLIGTSTIAQKGLSQVNELFPDLVFLDIDMPDMSGLQVAESLKKNNFQSEIVFTTAFEQYAFKTLSIEPLDFLTKPFSTVDLQRVINKFLVRAERRKLEQKLDIFIQAQSHPPHIQLNTTNGLLFIDIKDIVSIKAQVNGTEIYINDGTVERVPKRLNRVISLINSSLLFQINRGTFVNLNYLVRIEKRKSICIIRFNDTLHEEPITRSNIAIFNKLTIFPTF